MDYDTFESIFTTVLDKHAPLRMKTIRGNEKPHMNKIIKKAVMECSRLWNIYCRNDKNSQDYDAYRKQRNLVVKLNKRAKKQHFQKAIQNAQGRPKEFWKFCKPFFQIKAFLTLGLS